MSEARDKYRKFIVDHAWECDDTPVLNYVIELKQQNKQMLELLVSASLYENYDHATMKYIVENKIKPFIDSVTGKKIEEVLK